MSILDPKPPTRAELTATYVPKWKANTAYLAGDKVLSPAGDIVSAKANFTSGASYNAANWDLPTTFAQPGTDAGIPGYGLVPQNLGKWKAAVANVRAGLGHAHILCAGTSKTWGFPSSYGAGKSWPSQLEKMLNAYHVPAAEGWVSCSSKSSSDNVLDPRITKGSGWAAGGAGTGPGQGGGMQWVSGTGAMSFTPGYQFDTISLFYVTFGNKGTVTVNVNGGASLGSINANAAAGLAVSTVTTTLGTGTINVTAPTGGDFQLLAFRAYDSTRTSVLVSNFGVDASKSADWAENSAAFSSLNTWDKLTPDLSIILHSTNDAGNTVPVNTYTTNMTTLIDKAATYGSVIVGTETPDNDSEPNYVNFEALYQPALKDLAAAKGIPYLNLTKRYASETAGRTLGFIHADRVHLTQKGSADVASAIYKALTV